MLIRFVYLDKEVLAGYSAQLDGGLIAETKVSLAKKGSVGGHIDLKVAGAKGDKGSENAHETTLSYPPEAQFQRLLAAANEDPDTIGWIGVMNPDDDFQFAQIGEIVAWECNLEIDQASRVAARGGGGPQLVGMLETLFNAAAANMLDGNNEPTPEQSAKVQLVQAQMAMIKPLIEGLDIKRVVVGRDPGTTKWSIFGSLADEHIVSEDINNDRLIIVGKIKRIVKRGETGLLVNTEAIGLMQMLMQNSASAAMIDNSKNQITGPALELDVLAIYR